MKHVSDHNYSDYQPSNIMTAIAIQRSDIIKLMVDYDGDFSCTYEAQIYSHTGNLLSTMFDRDVREEHAFFVMLLSREYSTPQTFISFFKEERELLDYMLDYYQCQKLKMDIRETRIVLNKQRTVASFVNGIQQRMASRRALELPMFVPNE